MPSRLTAKLRYAVYYKEILARANNLYLQGGSTLISGLALLDSEWNNIVSGHSWAEQNLTRDVMAAELCSAYSEVGIYCLELRLPSSKRVQWLETALRAAHGLGHRKAEAVHLNNLGLAWMEFGDLERAVGYFKQSLDLNKEFNDQHAMIVTLNNLGVAYSAMDVFDVSIDYHQRALDISRNFADKRNEANALAGLGRTYRLLGDKAKAIDYNEQAVAIAREVGDLRGLSNALGNLANTYADLGSYNQARAFYEQQLTLATDIGDQYGLGNALLNMGLVLAEQGVYNVAITNVGQALGILEQIESPAASQARGFLLEQIIRGPSQARQLAIEVLADRSDTEIEVQQRIIAALADEESDVRRSAVKALSKLVSVNRTVRDDILARLDDSDESVRKEAAAALGSLATTDDLVRKSLLSFFRTAGKEDPTTTQTRRFFEAAKFTVQVSKDAHSFVCMPNVNDWKGKIRLQSPVYIHCFFGEVLDRRGVLKIYEAARGIADFKMLFVIVDQTPSDSGWIEVSALRSEGVQFIPIDEAIIQQGRERQKEQEKLQEYLLRFIGYRNLFDVRNPVVDRLNFFGREARANELLEMLSQGSPLALLGLRKMGKSSLVQYLRDTVSFPVAYVDLQAGEELTVLYNRILGSWQRSLRIHLPNINWLPTKIQEDPSRSFVTTTLNLMELLENSEYSPRLGLFVDEIEVIVPRLPGPLDSANVTQYMSFARALRGIIQETEHLSLLVVGVDPLLNRISRVQGQQNPFYTFFREEYLGPLGREECIQMVRNIGRQMDLEFDDKAAQFVADVSGGQPFWARQLCSATIEMMGDALGSKIELNHLLNAAQRFIREPGTASLLNENGLWGEITDPALWPEPQVIENKGILTSLARSEPQPEEELLAGGRNREARERSMFELEDRTVLSRLEQSLKIRFSLFRQWIEKYQLQGE